MIVKLIACNYYVQISSNYDLCYLKSKLSGVLQEANKMVQDANIKRMTAERSLTEANNRVMICQQILPYFSILLVLRSNMCSS